MLPTARSNLLCIFFTSGLIKAKGPVLTDNHLLLNKTAVVCILLFLAVNLILLIIHFVLSFRRIRIREQHLSILENASEYIVIMTPGGFIKSCISGQILAENIYDFIQEGDRKTFQDAVKLCLREKDKVIKFDMRMKDLKNGTDNKDYSLTLRNFIHRKGTRGLVADFRDISDRKNLERALREAMLSSEKAARTDFLTHIPNRRYFLETAERDLHKIKRSKKGSLSILMIDIDYFKRVNDQFGHDQGDQVLKEISWILTKETRSTDFLSRYGGEEFIALLHDTDKESVFQTADRFRKVLEEYKWAIDYQITASIGVSVYREDHRNITDLINEADKALYKAKETGRNRVVIFSKDM